MFMGTNNNNQTGGERSWLYSIDLQISNQGFFDSFDYKNN